MDSASEATRKSVAPAASARAFLRSLTSTATTVAAPAARAAATTERPTPPRPTTSTDCPGATRAVLRTAPVPVSAAQPRRAAAGQSRSDGTPITAFSGTTTCSAKAPRPSATYTGAPSRVLPFSRAAMPDVVAHSHGSPCSQNQHIRHAGCQLSATWSPAAARLTPAPVSTTSPAASCPRTSGYGGCSVPLTMDRSEWQTPAARIRTRT